VGVSYLRVSSWLASSLGGLSHELHVENLIKRQSSDDVGDIVPAPGPKAPCGQSAPHLLASRSPCHEDEGCGGRQRYSPTGAAAGNVIDARCVSFGYAAHGAIVRSDHWRRSCVGHGGKARRPHLSKCRLNIKDEET
jgi:hypothetical protein